MFVKHPRLTCAGWFIGTILLSFPITAGMIALVDASPVLFVIIGTLSCLSLWFFWLEPFAQSINRDVMAHMHERDD